jgi:hypothetical protein
VTPPVSNRGRCRPHAASATVSTLLTLSILIGGGLLVLSLRAGRAAAPTPATAPVAPLNGATVLRTTHTATVDVDAAPPVRLLIQRLTINAPVVPLAMGPDGSLRPPSRWSDAGWWVDGPEPGEAGAAVLAGHLDSTRGPAVFYHLAELQPGDPITIIRRDATQVTYLVQRSGRYPKSRFPTRAVYQPTRTSTLRLITCGGAFDKHSRHYTDNTIIYATRTT